MYQLQSVSHDRRVACHWWSNAAKDPKMLASCVCQCHRKYLRFHLDFLLTLFCAFVLHHLQNRAVLSMHLPRFCTAWRIYITMVVDMWNWSIARRQYQKSYELNGIGVNNFNSVCIKQQAMYHSLFNRFHIFQIWPWQCINTNSHCSFCCWNKMMNGNKQHT